MGHRVPREARTSTATNHSGGYNAQTSQHKTHTVVRHPSCPATDRRGWSRGVWRRRRDDDYRRFHPDHGPCHHDRAHHSWNGRQRDDCHQRGLWARHRHAVQGRHPYEHVWRHRVPRQVRSRHHAVGGRQDQRRMAESTAIPWNWSCEDDGYDQTKGRSRVHQAGRRPEHSGRRRAPWRASFCPL